MSGVNKNRVHTVILIVFLMIVDLFFRLFGCSKSGYGKVRRMKTDRLARTAFMMIEVIRKPPKRYYY